MPSITCLLERNIILENFTNGLLDIKVSISGGKSTMTWLGQSESRNPSSELDPYLDSTIAGLKGLDLTIKFNNLEYMNSSTVPPIIQFLKKLNTESINTEITYDVNSKWQAASFKALETFSGILKFITVKGT